MLSWAFDAWNHSRTPWRAHALAESGLKRLSPLATSTLIIAANLPDVDGACYLHSADLAFGFRQNLRMSVTRLFLLRAFKQITSK